MTFVYLEHIGRCHFEHGAGSNFKCWAVFFKSHQGIYNNEPQLYEASHWNIRANWTYNIFVPALRDMN